MIIKKNRITLLSWHSSPTRGCYTFNELLLPFFYYYLFYFIHDMAMNSILMKLCFRYFFPLVTESDKMSMRVRVILAAAFVNLIDVFYHIL